MLETGPGGAIARSTPSGPAYWMVVMTSPVTGLIVSKDSPEVALT